MDANPPPTLAERFATLVRWLGFAVDGRRVFGLGGPVIGLVIVRLCRINQLFARVAAGRFFPRPRAVGASRATNAPRAARPVPALRLPRSFGWLLPMLPEAAGALGQLELLFRDPEMIALMQAAPIPMARALRPLCRMLGLHPPPVIAPPARSRRPRAARPAPPRPPPGASPRPPVPEWLQDRRKPWFPARNRGSPRRS